MSETVKSGRELEPVSLQQLNKVILAPGDLNHICNCIPGGVLITLFPTDDHSGQEGKCKKCGTVYFSPREVTA